MGEACSSGYGRWLIFERSWVQISMHRWTFHFFTLICCKKLYCLLEKTENKQKRGWGWPIKKNHVHFRYLNTRSLWLWEMGDSRGRGFKSRCIDGHFIFSHWFVVKNCIVCLKRPKINKKEAGVGPLRKIMYILGTLTPDPCGYGRWEIREVVGSNPDA